MTSPRQRHYHPLGTEERHLLDQQLQEQRFAALEAERDRVFASEYTFKPKLTTPRRLLWRESTHAQPEPMATEASTEDNVGQDTATELTLQAAAATQTGSVFVRLAAKAAEREDRQRARDEEHRQKQALAERGAFRPHVNARSKTLAERAMALDTLPVQDRLLQYGRNVARSHEAQRQAAQEKEAAAFAAPVRAGSSTDPYHRSASKQAFETRNAALLEQRERRQAKAAVTETGAFRPRISSTSALLDEQRRRRLRLSAADTHNDSTDEDDLHVSRRRHSQVVYDPSTDRGAWLYAEAQRVQQQKEEARQALIAQEEREVFRGRTPQTNPISDDWIAHGEHQRLFACDFVTRQGLYQRAQEAERALLQQADREAELSTSPQRLSPGKVSAREVDAQVTRLYDRARERSQQHRQRLAEKVRADEDCTFAPQLSPGTKHVIRQMQSAREGDVVKRLTEASERRAAPPSRSAFPAEHEVATAAPRTVSVAEADVFYRRQMAQVSRKAYKMDMERKEHLTEDLLQCTFRPKTNADAYYQHAPPHDGISSAATGPAQTDSRAVSAAPISGVAAFLQRQAEAKRLRAEKAARVSNMGRGRPLSPNHRTTRFQPFTLTGDVRVVRLGTDTTGVPDAKAGARTATAGTSSRDRPFLSNLSTNSGTRALSLPPKRDAAAPTRTGPRSRSALKPCASEDRKNLSVSFADTSDEQQEVDVDEPASSQPSTHADPYDIQALMQRLRGK